ncbi:universal stress protein [Candidatus Bathyarchaeota archaeon]|nr:universal stress protein [Candidatus Bathyarchaeota archaeon]
MFNKIVVPLDNSEYADKALEIAIDLAQKYSGSLILVNIVPTTSTLITSPEGTSSQILMNLGGELEENGRRILEEGAKKAREAGLPVTTVLEHGNISDHIISISEKEKAGLVVIGERGLGSVARIFLGSVANNVSHHASCPVLIVKL